MKISKRTWKAIINALIEYFLITAPIGLYVTFESIHKHSWTYMLSSPEWGIATIFLIFIGITNYVSSARKCKKEVDETIIRVLVVSRFFLITVSILVTLFSVLHDNIVLKVVRSLLFLFISAGFIIMISASDLMNENK